MGIPYLITGLPRTRTAWMSIAASMGPASICFHEPMSESGSWRKAAELWQSETFKYIGIADSAFGFHLSEILHDIRPRTLVIERPQADVAASLGKLSTRQTNYCDLLAARIEEFKSHLLVKTISFSALRDNETVLECLDWLMPGLYFDRAKIEQLQNMNITVDMDRVWRLAVEHKHQMLDMIGPDALLMEVK